MKTNLLNSKTVTIIGATASGKTALTHTLCEELEKKGLSCEVVNLDAFQIYKGLNAGTAKPSPEEQTRYRYHGIDVCFPHENLDANAFAALAHSACADIVQRNKIPLCVGGSGLYLRAFLHGLDALPTRNTEIRKHIQDRAEREGWPSCHTWLTQVDPIRAQQLHPNDKVRIERALEVFLSSGTPMSDHLSRTTRLATQKTLFPSFVIHVEPPKEELKKRITERVPQLFAQGWVEEVEHLLKQYGTDLENFYSMRAIGYLQILQYLSDGRQTPMSTLISQIATVTTQYAKRQTTWNAKEKKDFTFSSPLQKNELFAKVFHFLREDV